MPLSALAQISQIVAPRLILRPVVEADLGDLLEINADPQTTRYLPYATWQSHADGQAWLARMQALGASGTGRQLVLVRRADARVVGTLLLFKHDPGSARIELGYVLGRAHWGQGLMREAVDAACVHAFAALDMRRIEAEVNPANVASCRLLQRLGFALEGRLRQRWVTRGEAYDVHVFGLLRDDPRPPGHAA